MTASLPGVFNPQQFTDSGGLASGYRIYTYIQGTTTFKAAYTDHAGLVPHTYVNDGIGGQYIALNSRGELPSPLFLDISTAYDIALKRPDGSTVWTRRADPIPATISYPVAVSDGGTGATTAANARSALGLAIGSDIQAFMTAASQAEMVAGTETALRSMSPLRIAQAIAALGYALPTQTGNIGKVLKTNGTTASWDGAVVLGTAVASTSGTAIDFTSIPSWVKRITINFSSVSTSGASFPLVQIGDSGVPATSGYVGCTQRGTNFAAHSVGWTIDNGAAASNTISGSMVISLLDQTNKVWVCSGNFGLTGIVFTSNVAGTKTLTNALNMVRITTVTGSDTFDGGYINILME